MKKITVHYQGWGEHWPLGTLAQDSRQLLFEYSPQALQRGLELSPLHLKLRPQTYGNFPAHQMQLPGLVADSLPDGWGLLLMDRFFKAHRHLERHHISPLDRLAFLGERAMGALSFEPASDDPHTPVDWALQQLAQEVQSVVQGQDGETLQQLITLGGSPQGARPKALVQYEPDTGHMSTLASAPGQAWMVKFPAANEHPEVCALEHVYAEMARLCGIDMPPTRYFELAHSLAAFAVQRFDRAGPMRVPMHTLAGALHADYRIPSSDYLTLLRMTRLMTRSEHEVLKAFRRCVFNVVFHNRDDHTKNFSYLLNPQGHWQLAPGYDLTYCEGPRGEHQMDIEGEGLTPTRTQLLRLADKAGLHAPTCQAMVSDICTQATHFQELAIQHPIRKDTVKRIAQVIQSHIQRLS